jgi:hypothetical protein
MALLTVLYQWWRDYLSTVPAVTVLAKLRVGRLDVAVNVMRNPTVIIEIGLCTMSPSGRIEDSEVLSSSFHALGIGDNLVLSDILHMGVDRELEEGKKYKVYVESVSRNKSYSATFQT